jgi:hypothetical protein
MTTKTEESNKALVLEAFDTLFNKRDYEAAARFWSPSYIQHSAHIEPGREGLFNLVRALPPTLKYEPGVIAASGDYVIVHGRFSGQRPAARLDRRGRVPHRQRGSRRALGCTSRRGDEGRIQERLANVRPALRGLSCASSASGASST